MKIKITILLSGLLAAAAFSGCTAEGDMPSAQPLTAIRAVNTGRRWAVSPTTAAL